MNTIVRGVIQGSLCLVVFFQPTRVKAHSAGPVETARSNDFQGAVSVARVAAEPGDERWRSGFHAAGLSGRVYALTHFNGALIAGGQFDNAGPIVAEKVAGWDGQEWKPLGGGITGGILVQALTTCGGDLIAGGFFSGAGGAPVNNIAAWDGSSWRALGGGLTGGYVLALACYDGMLIAGGNFTEVEGRPAGGIAFWDGSSWKPLGTVTGSLMGIRALTVYDGRLIIGGDFDAVDGVPAHNIAAWDGTTWKPLGDGPRDGSVEAFATFRGELVAGGSFWNAGLVQVNGVARWNGSSWAALAGGVGQGQLAHLVSALEVHDDQLFVGGIFEQAGGVVVNAIARWDGTSWHGLGSGLAYPEHFLPPYTLAIASFEGALYVGGSFSQAGGVFTPFLARWSGESWEAVAPGNGVEFGVLDFCHFGNGVAAGGLFPWAGQVQANHVAVWQGDRWDILGSGTDRPVHAVLEYKGELIVGGQFTRAGDSVASRIARWDGTSWHTMGAGFDSTVWDLETFRGELVASGAFKRSGNTQVPGVARWNGAEWMPFGEGLNEVVFCLAVHDDKLFAGGNFTASGETQVSYVAQWDGMEWSAVGPGFDSSVRALATFDGNLVAAGVFTASGSTPLRAIAQWDGSQWSGFVASGHDFEVGDAVNALAVLEGALFAGGFFEIGGSDDPNGNIGKWDGASWQPLGSGTSNLVYALVAWGSSLVVGGGFGLAGGKPSCAIAIWDAPVAIDVEDFGALWSEDGVTLSWRLSHGALGGVTGIRVERSNSESGPFHQIGSIADVQPVGYFIDNTAEALSAYWYRLTLEFRSGRIAQVGAIRVEPAGPGALETALHAPIVPPRGEPITIRYSIGQPRTWVELDIYDARGRLTRALEHRVHEAGEHSRLWDRRDEGGRSVPSGMYLLRLKAGPVEAARKLLVQ